MLVNYKCFAATTVIQQVKDLQHVDGRDFVVARNIQEWRTCVDIPTTQAVWTDPVQLIDANQRIDRRDGHVGVDVKRV